MPLVLLALLLGAGGAGFCYLVQYHWAQSHYLIHYLIQCTLYRLPDQAVWTYQDRPLQG